MRRFEDDREDRKLNMARIDAVAALIDRQRRIAGELAELAGVHEAEQCEYAKQIKGLVGPDVMTNNRGQYEDLKRQIAEIPFHHHPTSEGAVEGTRQRKALASQVHHLYHEIKLDTRQALGLRRDRKRRTMAAVDKFIHADEMEERFADELPELPHNPWKKHTSPYDYDWKWFSGNGSIGGWDVDADADRKTGMLNLDSSVWIMHPWADEEEWVTLVNMAEIGFWYQMEAPGRVQVVAELKRIKATYNGCVEDESGCSDGHVRQKAEAYLITYSSQLGWGTEVYTPVYDKRYADDRDHCWSHIHPYSVIKKAITSVRSHAAGEWVLVVVGIRNFHHFDLDDMSGHGEMDTRLDLDVVHAKSITQ